MRPKSTGSRSVFHYDRFLEARRCVVVVVVVQFHSGLAAWAPGLQRRGVLAIGPDLPSLVEQAPDRGRHRGRPRSGARGRGHLVLLFPVVHGRGLPSRSARPVQPQAPRRRAWSRLPVLSRLGRDFCRRERSAHADLHELPSAREEGQRGARTDSGKRHQRQADALDSRPRASRLRLFHPPRARDGRNRLRHLPRPHRRDGNGHADGATQHGLVPRLPPQPRSQPTPRLGGHQHEVDPSPGRRNARWRSSNANDRSIRRLTVRGATGESNLLAKSRAARGQPRIPRLSRAGVPGGRLGAPRRDHPARHDHAPGRLAVDRGACGVRYRPASRRKHRPVRQRARGHRPRASPATTRRRCRSAGAPTASSSRATKGGRPRSKETRRTPRPSGRRARGFRRPCSASTIPTARKRSD